jgi:hypothetical protein
MGLLQSISPLENVMETVTMMLSVQEILSASREVELHQFQDVWVKARQGRTTASNHLLLLLLHLLPPR